MSLLSSAWECKYEQDFMPDREITRSRLLFRLPAADLAFLKVPINWAFFVYVCFFLGNYVT